MTPIQDPPAASPDGGADATPIVVWGAGGHAKVVAQTLRRARCWRIEGFIDDFARERRGEIFCGAAVLGGRDALPALRARGVASVVLAFGNNAARLALWRELGAAGWSFPPVVDPAATIADDVRIGAGSYVAAGAVIQPGATIGAQVIVNTGAIVEHDCRVGDGVHLCPRSCIAGHVEVGAGTWLGAGAIVRDRVRIGEHAFVGVGALVLGDTPGSVVAYGQPARVVREVQR